MRAAFVAASAHNFGFVGNAFAVGAAILLLLGCIAVASGICAFLGAGHFCLLGGTDRAVSIDPGWTARG